MQDVYTGVAQEVQRIAEQDAREGMLEAQALLGNVDRKLVKQTVMTSVYGVTWVGAREQVQNRLKDKGWVASDNLTFKVSMYAASVRAPSPKHHNQKFGPRLGTGSSIVLDNLTVCRSERPYIYFPKESLPF